MGIDITKLHGYEFTRTVLENEQAVCRKCKHLKQGLAINYVPVSYYCKLGNENAITETNLTRCEHYEERRQGDNYI